MKQILRNRSLNIIPLPARKPIAISGAQIEMRSLQLIILFIMIDNIGNSRLLIETLLIDSILRKIRFDNIHLAQMPSAVTISTHTFLLMMMRKIRIRQF